VIRMRPDKLVRIAALMALVALACMGWSLVAPSPVSIMVAMSVGQGLGALSLALYLVVVIAAARRAARAAVLDSGGGAPREETDA
jgi:hypothetical protein